MSNKSPEQKDGLLELLKKLWLPVAGFLGAITLAYNFYQLWLGDQAGVTWFLAGGGLVVLVVALGCVGFITKAITRVSIPTSKNPNPSPIVEKQPAYPRFYKLARIALGFVFIGLAIGGVGLVQHRRALEEKLIVLIAAFEGPEEVYGLRNEIIESLNADFGDAEEIEIIIIDEIVTLTEGSEYARKLGERRLADIIVWGWYRPTENPNITIHIENLFPDELTAVRSSETLQPIVSLAELESFSFQQQAGQETSALISFLIGIVEYNSSNFESAIGYFDASLGAQSLTPKLLENQYEIYLYRGNSKASLLDHDGAIQDFSQAYK